MAAAIDGGIGIGDYNARARGMSIAALPGLEAPHSRPLPMRSVRARGMAGCRLPGADWACPPWRRSVGPPAVERWCGPTHQLTCRGGGRNLTREKP
uniref:Uncharacterized protein n=1 Tax=uncultured Armatimonadetes bacterium TaxID=157466 RepID=A0A6J4HL13_9BACT|nr:hypothetical protein AVDCRST_MAG63-770 [uncultured Armatimonadetes bacterium]